VRGDLYAANSRQYVLAESAAGPSHFTHVGLPNGLTLSHDPLLQVVSVDDADGSRWWLLGWPLASHADRADPAVEVAGCRTVDVIVAAETWTGRWQLLGEQHLVLDAAGSMGCYFRTSGPVRISSSAALLGATRNAPELSAGRQLVWYPGPSSGYADVARLLPSQQLKLATGEVVLRGLLSPSIVAVEPPDPLDRIESILVDTVARAAQHYERVLLPLTAGLDSRLLLAACVAAGSNVSCYTQTYSEISAADVALPPQLAASVGFPHRLVRPGRTDPDVLRLHRAHTAGQTIETGQRFMARGQFVGRRARDLVLGGGGFETARGFYWSRLAPELPRSGRELAASFGTQAPHAVEGFQEWLGWIQQHPEELDWRDRFYWEQRMGGWLAASEQAMDLVPGDRLLGANTRELLSLLLALPVEMRIGGQHQKELIGRLAPELLRFPINSPDSRLRRRWRKLRRRASREWTNRIAARPSAHH
jgi:hypothetical protein